MSNSVRFPSLLLRISANALALLLLANLPKMTEQFTFYKGSDSQGFLKLCVSCKDCVSCSTECKALLREDVAVEFDPTENPCSPKNLKDLKAGQETVRKFQNKIDSYTQSIILWALFIPSICIGIYLIAVGHFDWRTLPIIGSKYHPNPTTGIPYWQYYRMKYVVFKSEACKHGPGGVGVQDKCSNISFAYSSVGSGTSESDESGGSDRVSGDFNIPYQPSKATIFGD